MPMMVGMQPPKAMRPSREWPAIFLRARAGLPCSVGGCRQVRLGRCSLLTSSRKLPCRNCSKQERELRLLFTSACHIIQKVALYELQQTREGLAPTRYVSLFTPLKLVLCRNCKEQEKQVRLLVMRASAHHPGRCPAGIAACEGGDCALL